MGRPVNTFRWLQGAGRLPDRRNRQSGDQAATSRWWKGPARPDEEPAARPQGSLAVVADRMHPAHPSPRRGPTRPGSPGEGVGIGQRRLQGRSQRPSLDIIAIDGEDFRLREMIPDENQATLDQFRRKPSKLGVGPSRSSAGSPQGARSEALGPTDGVDQTDEKPSDGSGLPRQLDAVLAPRPSASPRRPASNSKGVQRAARLERVA